MATTFIPNQRVETSEPIENFLCRSGKYEADGAYRGLIQLPGEIKWRWFQYIPGADGRNTVIIGVHAKYKGYEENAEGRQVCKPSNRPW